MSRFTVPDLAATIDARTASGGEASYTKKLLDKGAEHCAKKLGEEAVETVIAAVENDRHEAFARGFRPRVPSLRECRTLAALEPLEELARFQEASLYGTLPPLG